MLRRILKELTKNVMKKNKEFHRLHLGEECYIIGNGDSIKYFDLGCFNDKISFGCNILRVHKDFNKLNLKYYVSVHPLLYSPIWRGVQSGAHLEINPYYNFYKNLNNTGYIHFVHASNYFFIKNKSKYRFVHNLNKKPLDIKYCDFTSSSSFVDGGLSTMIGLAIYMGFQKAYLVGCDYFYKPIVNGHFWDRNNARYDYSSTEIYGEKLISSISDAIDLTVITRKGFSSIQKSIQYENLFNTKENFKHADKIISKRNLKALDKTLYLRYSSKKEYLKAISKNKIS